jgi:hypothetical protein
MANTAQPSLIVHLWKNVSPILRPQYKRIRSSFIGLLMFIGLDLMLRGWERVPVSVAPMAPIDGSLTDYGTAASLKAGTLIINHPDFIVLLFSNQGGNRSSLFTLLMMAIVSMIIIRIAPKLSDQNVFRKDISRSIQWIGALLIIHGVATMFGAFQIAEIVKSITNGVYTNASLGFNPILYAQVYIGMVIVAAGGWYRQGVRMREEQDLTI